MGKILIIFFVVALTACQSTNQGQNQSIKIATFNVSMEATNYVAKAQAKKGARVLMDLLADGKHQQIHNIAEIIQRTRPDIILLNEFDYIENPKLGIQAFIDNYLAKPHHGSEPIDYPYVYLAPSNTGLPTNFDLNNNGKLEGFGSDAHGFGFYHGHYAMVLLSKYPIEQDKVRTFARFLWSDMPDAAKPIDPQTHEPYYNKQEWLSLRLSSKSHWDIPVNVDGTIIHVLASHPTPPVFDGPEDRNGGRNHDEIRFWTDYITPSKGEYIYDDNGRRGGLKAEANFVVLGDLNSAEHGGNSRKEAIVGLKSSPRVNNQFIPQSAGGAANKADNPRAKYHTSHWGMRVDYVLPSARFTVKEGGVFWPTVNDELYRLVKDRKASSDHRLVWLELVF